MAQTIKTPQEVYRERQMKDMKRAYYFDRAHQLWTLLKRLALVGGLAYGGVWASKSENQQTLKRILKSHSAPIEQQVGNFKEGTKMLAEGFGKKDKASQSYYDQRQKQIDEYRKVGIDPVVRYAESGTKEYKEELEFYRKSGVFNARDD